MPLAPTMMKKPAPLLLGLALAAAAQAATIKIDVKRVIDQVDPRIYGVFMEPIGFNHDGVKGNTLYGPVYDPKSPLADEHGFRKDYIEAARELQITNMRWPGGNFVSGYDWRDGIGPKDQRPRRMELAWGVVESNQVGTDEWVQLNAAIGSANVVCINLGTGTLDDARFWVEYCNAPAGTSWADQRSANGHPEPYHVKYWCLGNEVDGSPWILGYKNAADYCKFAVEAAKVMRKTSRDIELIACGASNYKDNIDWVEWNWKVVNELSGVADYLSVHRYWNLDKDYSMYMGAQAMELEEKISIPAAQLRAVAAVRHTKPMFISFDEWAPHGRGHLSTLAMAQFFNAFIRHADMVKMANFTLLTSILGRDLATNQTYKSPVFHTFKLFSTHCRGDAVDACVDCGTFKAGERYPKVPYLDVTAVHVPESNKLVINVVNRHRDEPIETDIVSNSGDFAGPATASLIQMRDGGDDLNTPYTYANRGNYEPATEEIATAGSTIHHRFPPHSFTQIVVGLAAK